MPIFEYKCKCGNEFEHLLLPSAPEEAECPKCHGKGEDLEKLISRFGTPNEGATAAYKAWAQKENHKIAYEHHRNEAHKDHDH